LKIPALAALFWAVSFFAPCSFAVGALTAEGLKKSLAMNENLLTKSSLVRNVKEVNLPQVSETLEKALSFHKIALEKLSKNDLTGSLKARDESLRLLMLASRLAHQATGFAEEVSKASYEKKLKSVQGLLAAHKRITDLNSDSETEQKLQESISKLLVSSKKNAEQQKFKEAFSALSKAYFLIASSIKTQRTGQTLIRSLDFATEKEAYEYELGRYENYQMLVNMMIDERKAFKRNARTKPFFDEASRYEAQAESLVKEGQYSEASKLIEKASKTLVNLLRDSGVHIPGV
jgi:tetratricopeptide (TPR) repeat protein